MLNCWWHCTDYHPTSQHDLQELVDRLHNVSSQDGLQLNKEKNKSNLDRWQYMHDLRWWEYIGQAWRFLLPCLGHLPVTTSDAGCSKEIKARLGKGQNVSVGLTRIWQSHDIAVATKVRLMRALVWLVAVYGCKSWILLTGDERRIRNART